MRTLLLLAVVACRPAEGARPESRATVSGVATFTNGPVATDTGSIAMTIRGTAEDMDNACRSDQREFIATYDGNLALDGNGAFTAALYPRSIVTPDNCMVTSLRVEHIDAITLDAQLGDRAGRGALTYQNLAAVDGDELRTGAFDDLVGTLDF